MNADEALTATIRRHATARYAVYAGPHIDWCLFYGDCPLEAWAVYQQAQEKGDCVRLYDGLDVIHQTRGGTK